MAAPVADSFAAASGATLRAGRYASRLAGGVTLADLVASGSLAQNLAQLSGGIALDDAAASGSIVGFNPPAWMSGKAVGEWAQIAGTTAPGVLKDYCGLAWRDEPTLLECASLAAGGHGGNTDYNGVLTLRLDVDSPSWVERKAGSSTAGWNSNGSVGSGYMPSDGAPAARHTYWATMWVPERNRYMLFGAKSVGSLAYDFNNHDGFNPDTNTWDAAGAYASISGRTSFADPSTGIIYGTQGALVTWNPTTQAWAAVGFSGTGTVNRGGSAFDTLRGNIYHLSTGDNFSTGGAVCSTRITTAGVRTPITFNSSAGYTDFVANQNNFLTTELQYDADLDRFYFYNGGSEGAQKIYRITPNGGTTWDMDLMTVTGVTPSVSLGGSMGGVCSKFRYISRFKICLLVVPNQNVYFVRTQ